MTEGRCERCGSALDGPVGCARCLLALGLSEGVSSDRGNEPPGRIGPYRVLDTLPSLAGKGVYLAGKEEEPGRRLEVEVLEPEADAAAMLERFGKERARLLAVDHPGLAKVVDAGTTSDGRGWLAAEWTGGVPITEHCDRERLRVDQRLVLLLDVCDAVARAHEGGVVHGEIAPASVRVTRSGEVTRPRVADLGRATVAGPGLTARTFGTAFGLLAAAPGYLSPEHIQGPPSIVDARTDVYALGALLCELLCGCPPFESRRLRQAGWERTGRIVCRRPPTVPSARVAALPADAAAEVARRRRTTVPDLVRALRGDLDAIVGQALEKDPSRRYQGVRELADDLGRHRRRERIGAPATSAVSKALALLDRARAALLGPRSR